MSRSSQRIISSLEEGGVAPLPLTQVRYREAGLGWRLSKAINTSIALASEDPFQEPRGDSFLGLKLPDKETTHCKVGYSGRFRIT